MNQRQLELNKLRDRQFEIMRRGLREAAQVLLEMERSLGRVEDEVVSAPVVITERPKTNTAMDIKSLEDELFKLVKSEQVIDVTDDMIVEVSSTPLQRLEGFLSSVQSYKANRPSLH